MASTINAKSTGSGSLESTADASGILALQTGGVTAVTIDTSQNVGIGTTTPGTKVQVFNSGSTDTRFSIGNANAGFQVGVESTGACLIANFVAQPISMYTNGLERMRIDSSGNVGIGVTPSAWTSYKVLQFGVGTADGAVSSAGNETSVTTNAYNAGGWKYQSSSFATKYYQSNGAHVWQYTGSGTAGNAITWTEAMRIDTSGNVLVGTTSNFASGNVQGIAAQASGNASLALNRTTDTGAVARFYQAGTNVGRIEVTGSATSYVTSSDYRLKENIAPMTGALDKVAQLKPVTYTWKLDGSNGQGFIAHELQAVVPECVTGQKDAVNEDGSIDPQGIDTSFLVATLTAAIQEQQTIINDLKARITALEGAK